MILLHYLLYIFQLHKICMISIEKSIFPNFTFKIQVCRLLTGVYVSVLLHVALLVESLAAELTRIRSRVRMN